MSSSGIVPWVCSKVWMLRFWRLLTAELALLSCRKKELYQILTDLLPGTLRLQGQQRYQENDYQEMRLTNHSVRNLFLKQNLTCFGSIGMAQMTPSIQRSQSQNNYWCLVIWTNFYSWSYRRKWAATIVVSSFTFISPVSSAMVAPATEQIASEFGVTSNVLIAMTTSVFVLGYGTCYIWPLVATTSLTMSYSCWSSSK